MDENKMIEDLVRMLDSGMSKGVGHVNVEYDAEEAIKERSDNGLHGLFTDTVSLQCTHP